MWQKHQCRLCGDIISDHRQRRVLHSEGANRARIVLIELLAVHISTTELQQLLSPINTSTPGLSQSYICRRPCFASLDKVASAKAKVVKANQELDAAEQEIFSRLERLNYQLLEKLSLM